MTQDFLELMQKDTQKKAEDLKASVYASYRSEFKDLLNFLQPVDFQAEAEAAGTKKCDPKTLVILTISALKKQLEEDDQERYGIAFCDDAPYIFHSGYWLKVEQGEMQCFLQDAAVRLGVIRAVAEYHKFAEDLYMQFQVTARMRAPERKPDMLLLNLQNGTLEIRKGKARLRAPRRADFLTYKNCYSFDPSAKAPIFLQYLDRVLPDKEKQKILAVYTAYIMIPGLKWQKALFMTGNGNNGKSVFVQILKYLIGEANTEELTIDVLTMPNSKYLVHLEHKLLNISDDNSHVEIMDTGVFKKLVRGSAVPVNIMHKHGRSMTDYAKTIITANRLPKTKDHSEGFFRSFLVISFDQVIGKEERDPRLTDKIVTSELPGVLNWALEQMDYLMTSNGFPETADTEAALEEYRTEASSVMSFLDDFNVLPDPSHFEPVAETYRAYKYYCEESGFKPLSRRSFSAELRNLGRFEAKHTRTGDGYMLNRKPSISDNIKIE